MQLLDDPDYTRAIDAFVAGEIDVVVIPQQDLNRVQDVLTIPGVRLMSVAQAEAIAQIVPGLKHVVLWRGLLDLSRDIPNANVDMLASRNRMLVRKIFIQPCNICCWKRCVRSIGLQAPSIASGSFRPSNPMICLFLQLQRHFTALARPSGNATRLSGSRRFSTGLHSLSFRSS